MKNPFRLVGRMLKKSAPALADAALGFIPGGHLAKSALGRTAIREIAGALGVKLAKDIDDVTAASKVEAAFSAADADALKRIKERNIAFLERTRELDSIDRKAVIDNQIHARSSLRQFQGALRFVGIGVGALVVSAWVCVVCFVVWHVLTAGEGNVDYAALSTVMGLIIALGGAAGVVINLFYGGNPAVEQGEKDDTKKAG